MGEIINNTYLYMAFNPAPNKYKNMPPNIAIKTAIKIHIPRDKAKNMSKSCFSF